MLAISSSSARQHHIKYSLGTIEPGATSGSFHRPAGVTFDHARGLLYVVDSGNHRVQVFRSLDGSFVASINPTPAFLWPWSVAVDSERELVVVADSSKHRLQLLDANRYESLKHIGYPAHAFRFPRGVAIDAHRGRLVVADSNNHRVLVLEPSEYACEFTVDASVGDVRGVCVDPLLDRLIIVDSFNDRVMVASASDGSLLFEINNDTGTLLRGPRSVCVDSLSRIIVACAVDRAIRVFSADGELLSTLPWPEAPPEGVALDELRGLVAISAGNQVHVLEAESCLSSRWRPDRHCYASEATKSVVLAMTMVRSIAVESPVSLLPNELLFEIYQYL